MKVSAQVQLRRAQVQTTIDYVYLLSDKNQDESVNAKVLTKVLTSVFTTPLLYVVVIAVRNSPESINCLRKIHKVMKMAQIVPQNLVKERKLVQGRLECL